MPRRKKSDNKTAGGKCLILAGTKNMFGAGILAGTAAARIGAGYVYLMTDKKKFPLHQHPDFLLLERHSKNFNNATCIAAGPGMGLTAASLRLLKVLLRQRREAPVLLDADALTLLARHRLFPLPEHWLVTPHEGELSRLLKISAAKIRANRQKAVLQAQKKLGCTVLLKGDRTLVADRHDVFEIQAGNAALAKAGTGDVLTGMIAGLLAQGLVASQAACLGAYIHGFMADEWIKRHDPLSLMASDLVQALPGALAKIRKS